MQPPDLEHYHNVKKSVSDNIEKTGDKYLITTYQHRLNTIEDNLEREFAQSISNARDHLASIDSMFKKLKRQPND